MEPKNQVIWTRCNVMAKHISIYLDPLQSYGHIYFNIFSYISAIVGWLWMTTSHTVLEEKLNISQKMTTRETWTFYFRPLPLFARLSYYFIPCLRLTKLSTLLPAPLLASTQQVSLVVIENVTDIFFSKWPLLKRCEARSKKKSWRICIGLFVAKRVLHIV